MSLWLLLHAWSKIDIELRKNLAKPATASTRLENTPSDIIEQLRPAPDGEDAFGREWPQHPEPVEMPILFRADADLSKLKQTPYILSGRDREAFDEVMESPSKESRLNECH